MYKYVIIKDDSISLEYSFADQRLKDLFSKANTTKFEWERILAHVYLVIDYNNKGYVHQEEFINIVFF